MTAAEEYAALIQQQNSRHAAALAENAQLKAQVQMLRGITLTQAEIDAVINNLGADKLAEYTRRRGLEDMRSAEEEWTGAATMGWGWE